LSSSGSGLERSGNQRNESAVLVLPACTSLAHPQFFSSMYRITIDTEGRLALHRPNCFRGSCLSLKGGERIHIMAGVDPGYLNAGLMKPRRGFTLVAGKKKLGVGKLNKLVDIGYHRGYFNYIEEFIHGTASSPGKTGHETRL
jgi:hypothetical protein